MKLKNARNKIAYVLPYVFTQACKEPGRKYTKVLRIIISGNQDYMWIFSPLFVCL